jgi:hypothetical protein
MNEHYRAWRDALQDVIERGVSPGALHCAGPRGFAVENVAVVDGLAVQCFSWGSVPIASCWLNSSSVNYKLPDPTDRPVY